MTVTEMKEKLNEQRNELMALAHCNPADTVVNTKKIVATLWEVCICICERLDFEAGHVERRGKYDREAIKAKNIADTVQEEGGIPL